jgi:diaminopropionate ammonia-lyase
LIEFSSLMTTTKYFLNPTARCGQIHQGLFETDEYHQLDALLTVQPTPLRHLRALAAQLKIGDILVKDESERMGLTSFKILGVSYAIARLLNDGHIAPPAVLVCATEGNHGRAVARAAREHRLEAKIYVAADVASARIQAIEEEGAEVVKVAGSYDDAVRRAALDARNKSWTLISDTSWPGYHEIPRLIMLGYTRLLDEAEHQWFPEQPPDVVLVQAGVGGLACAVVSWFCQRYGKLRPFIIVCEPSSAACLLESAMAGKPISIPGPFHTIMAGLRCGEVSALAWPAIGDTVGAFVAIDDEQCISAMRVLARPVNGDPLIVAGASGACGLGALLAILQDERLRPVREASRVNVKSRVLVINTEGATDPELYARVIGDNLMS